MEAYSYSVTLFNKKKEQATVMLNNMADLRNIIQSEWSLAWVHTEWFHLYEIPEKAKVHTHTHTKWNKAYQCFPGDSDRN